MKLQEKIWIGTFITLWVLVSTVSTVHSVMFFGLTNNVFFAWCIAIGFEIGAMASLGGLFISRGSKWLVWGLFGLLTLMQIHGNMYWAWSKITYEDIEGWSRLFGLIEEEKDFQLRIFSFISGGILPIVSLGFIKSLMDYLDPNIKLEDESKDMYPHTPNGHPDPNGERGPEGTPGATTISIDVSNKSKDEVDEELQTIIGGTGIAVEENEKLKMYEFIEEIAEEEEIEEETNEENIFVGGKELLEATEEVDDNKEDIDVSKKVDSNGILNAIKNADNDINQISKK